MHEDFYSESWASHDRIKARINKVLSACQCILLPVMLCGLIAGIVVGGSYLIFGPTPKPGDTYIYCPNNNPFLVRGDAVTVLKVAPGIGNSWHMYVLYEEGGKTNTLCTHNFRSRYTRLRHHD